PNLFRSFFGRAQDNVGVDWSARGISVPVPDLEGDRVRIDPGDQADGGAAIDGEADEGEAAIGTVGDAAASRCEEDVRVPDRGACPAGDLLERGEALVVGEFADDFDPPGRADAKDEERPVVLGAFEAEGDDGAFGEAPVPRELEGMRLEPSGER